MRVVVRIAALSLLLAACGDDATGPSRQTASGNYVLVEAGNQPLPYRYTTMWIEAGYLRLEASGTFDASFTVSQVDGSDRTHQKGAGEWRLSGNALTLDYDNGIRRIGTLNNNRIFLNFVFPAVFQRE